MSLYNRLASYPDEDPEEGKEQLHADPAQPQSIYARTLHRLALTKQNATLTLLILSLGLNALFLGYNALQVVRIRGEREQADNTASYVIPPKNGLKPVYSPIQESVFYEYKKFDSFTQKSDFVPATDESDELWKQIWDPWQVSSVPREQAAQLWNNTERESGIGEPRYLIGLDVFHQLHCLDMLRKALQPERYDHHHIVTDFAPPGEDGDPEFNHIDHCVNNLRESIMCNADLTPNVIQWDPKSGANWARLDVVHTCVNWDSVVDWAREWRPHHKGHTNHSVKVPDDWVWQQPLRGVKGW